MNKLLWYYNRFSLMSPGEVCCRLSDELRKPFEKMACKDYIPDISLLDKKVLWYGSEPDRDKMRPLLDEDERNILQARADQYLDHRFTFFSLIKEDFGAVINWHKDYKSGKESPVAFCKTIDYRDFSRVGDIKYIWEVNRQQHLITLAKAYFLLGERRYKDEALAQINSWIDANPYMMGVNWASGLELSIRLISWAWVWHFAGDIPGELKNKWLKSIYQHCEVISKNFSRFSSANNHLIGEAAGLFIASVMWPFTEGSERWQLQSFKILNKEMERQNFADGVNKEQAVSYQQFVLDFFLLSGLLGEKNAIAFPKAYWQRLEKMMDFIAAVMDKEGHVPQFGDADDGFAVILSASQSFNVYTSLLATGAALFKRGDFKARAGDIDEKTLWLLGNSGYRDFDRLKAVAMAEEKKFTQGGYYILSHREGTPDEIKAVFDCGPLGYLSIAAHGHSDALSLVLSVSGREILVDPGTYAYHTQSVWRDYFRGTSAHNTIRVDGEDQSLSGGNFMWLKKAEARVIRCHEADGVKTIIGEHNGYHRLKDPVWHQRQVVFRKEEGAFHIFDHLDGKQEHIVEQFFHFSPRCKVAQTGANAWLVESGEVKVAFYIDEKFKVNLCRGGELPVIGWYSDRFDYKEPAFCLVNSYEGGADVSFETKIVIAQG